MTLASNRTLAEENLQLQPRLDFQKNELTKRYRCLQELYEAYQLRKSTLGEVAQLCVMAFRDKPSSPNMNVCELGKGGERWASSELFTIAHHRMCLECEQTFYNELLPGCHDCYVYSPRDKVQK